MRFRMLAILAATTTLSHSLSAQAPALAEAPREPRIEALVTAPIGSIRGLSVVDDSVAWVSGTQGKAGRTADGGKTWTWFSIPGCDSVDFRDVEGFSGSRAIVMGIASPAKVMLTEDGGKNWEQVYFNADSAIFLDAMDFYGDRKGYIAGDPLGGSFKGLVTPDGGKTWYNLPMPAADSAEAIFAASGTTLRALPGGQPAFATGGTHSRFYRLQGRKWRETEWPATQGQSSTGIFSFAFVTDKQGIAVGGDYLKPEVVKGNCLITADGGLTWSPVQAPPRGYRSAVEYIDRKTLVCTGPAGTDWSADGGQTWRALPGEGYHAVRKAKNGKAVYLAGSNGRIAILRGM
ncbi:YCF48-related protein [Chitinophaga sp.]|uniref:WD40/YVTN/BNR-like repeat-containing protein n=1 Tax=Chitinophaga sp. TaxID=1869181 RepID=UPI002629D824|nr:YCF48-related protein [uncultured Chitinophaga sp.]